jgi:hypothetical protein
MSTSAVRIEMIHKVNQVVSEVAVAVEVGDVRGMKLESIN